MTTMKLARMGLTAALLSTALPTLPACDPALDGAEAPAELAEGESALKLGLPPVVTTGPIDIKPEDEPSDPPPGAQVDDSDPYPGRDPLVPRREDLATLRLDMGYFEGAIAGLLGGTRISLDMTKQAPPVLEGTTTVCHEPAPEAYQDAREECLQLIVGRAKCLKDLNEQFQPVCYPVGIPHYSYMAFPAALKQHYPALTDKTFDLEPMHKQTVLGGVTVTLNQLRTTIAYNDFGVTAGVEGGQTYMAFATEVESNQPTAYCVHDHTLGFCPDLQLTDMELTVKLTGLHADPEDPSIITYDGVEVPFRFNRNINNTPDWLVAPFFDIDGRIRARTRARLSDTLLDPTRHKEMARVLTRAISGWAEQFVPGFTGFKVIDEVLYSNGELIVHYEPL